MAYYNFGQQLMYTSAKDIYVKFYPEQYNLMVMPQDTDLHLSLSLTLPLPLPLSSLSLTHCV